MPTDARDVVVAPEHGLQAAVPPAFEEALFGRVPAEDLARLSPADRAELAASAWRHLQHRRPGTPDISIASPNLPDLAEGVTVVEMVNDDMPFLLDSVMAEIVEQGCEVRLLAHPILAIDRDAEGNLLAFRGEANRADAEDLARESLILVHLDPVADPAALRAALALVLRDVRAATSGWRAMTASVRARIKALRSEPPGIAPAELEEAAGFLEWLLDGNFTFLGIEHEMRSGAGLRLDETSRLGILAEDDPGIPSPGGKTLFGMPEMERFLDDPVPLAVLKASARSRVHRRAHMDLIVVKLFAADGSVRGEALILGLFASAVYTSSPRTIPYLRRKIARVVARVGFDPDSHSGKALMNVLDTYPRDELFQIDADLLQSFALEIMTLYERPRIRVLPRPDRFGRFVSVLVYVLRDRYDSDARQRIAAYLARVFEGRLSAFSPSFPEGPLARVHFIIGRDGGEVPAVPRAVLEAEIARLVQTWPDALHAALAAAYPGAPGRALALRYANAFGAGYREAFDAATTLVDIETIERFGGQNRLAIDFYRPEQPDAAGLKVLALGRPLPLSERVPMLEAMGFTVVAERTFEIEPEGLEGGPVFLHDMTLARARGGPIDMEALAGRFEALLVEVLMGRVESDGYNALVLEGGLAWPDVVLVRTLSRYLRQARVPFSQDYMWATLVRHSGITARIVELFRARFDPDRFAAAEDRSEAEANILAAIEEDLKAVESLDEDRILRRFVNLVQASVRTNLFQTGADGAPKRTLAIKLDSRKVEDLPSPRPLFDLFVHSARVEGVHLRFGRIARGGIRWSDRPQDFRTEVLGLVKAQQVKNAVIVPVGAKGGFVPKKLPAGPREAVQAEGTAAYELFISTMLDITDNLDGKTLVPPERVVRHDGDDPYLVVAADKGTATFSDTANAISAGHHYWLGDAFASGGSVGYDHKLMGITARGAWVAVERHFRQLDVDIQRTPFTAVGVGDMSGDVFGNGMLLSPATRLLAAFDHRDIFLDPNPDPATSIVERRRLFELHRSSWKDYDKALISPGGGVFSRSLKSIPLTTEVRAALGFDKPAATPAELIRAILRAPVDLVFFGGIGTYVRASTETDEEVGDRANDAVRITGGEIRAKVVGEGANLGMTQRGRIEAARNGVRLNTDAIDNSAGVNTSDVEVNIKIGLSTPVREGALDEPARNALLAAMQDEVGRLVLRNNYAQTLAITLAERRGPEDIGFARRLMQSLESRGLLDRAVEALPDDASLAERARSGEGLTRPEIAVLLAYSKLALNADLLASGVPDDPYLSRDLDDYFPTEMRQRFLGAIETHRLRREIIATQLGNAMINRGGPTLIVRIGDQTGAEVPAVAASFAAVSNGFALAELNRGVDALDNLVPGGLQNELYAAIQELLLSRMVWFLRNVDLSVGLDAVVERFRPGIEAVRAWLATGAGGSAAARAARAAELVAAGVPEPLAETIAGLPALAAAPDAVLVAEEAAIPLGEAAALLFAAGEFFQVDRIVAAARTMPIGDHFERLAVDRAIDQLAASQRAIAIDAAAVGSVEEWAKRRPESARFRNAAGEIAAAGGFTLARLTVVTSLLGDLARRR